MFSSGLYRMSLKLGHAELEIWSPCKIRGKHCYYSTGQILNSDIIITDQIFVLFRSSSNMGYLVYRLKSKENIVTNLGTTF